MRATSFFLLCLVLVAAVLTSASQYEQKPTRRLNFLKRGVQKLKHRAQRVGNAAMNALPAVQNVVSSGMQVVDTVNQGRYMANSLRGGGGGRRRGRFLREANDEE
ncbi:unnamed protein product [Aphanomyces euteiches]|uniref:RxLR effector protein n=1 Tax=Aphanomyces euteiches TaxID=100861 RepID=A0A6G0W944_9STRA|nr:hypothetical protein Ae201684_017472 [Aphanomyces euteiches]KAH9083251.1 hypothetical protein LEN26_021033 [Aphanomyces euteiches]KAH9085358.1 hypothetical protein Ae201684P_005067 [Aphanomyces euteiches]KAH9112420.1 hypothetical protein AeMF1_013246 [Aphanomyces euteiches]KAH9139485.1 hypothetical protein AeRB84_016242 [Aphanomyces euteiches]